MISSALRFAFDLLLLFIGYRTILIGINDGIVRRRIRSRWHRDGRKLSGNSAVWYGASTALIGIAVVVLSFWLAVSQYHKGI
jgi:hypothetical protein